MSQMLRKLCRAEEGAVAVFAALGFFFLVVSTGAVIDVNVALKERARLQSALDGGLLAAMQEKIPRREANESEQAYADRLAAFKEQMEQFLKNHITQLMQPVSGASYLEGAPTVALTIDPQNATMRADASVRVRLPFTGSFFADPVKIGVGAETRTGYGSIEVALVLDTTGSMWGSKIAELRGAAKDFIDIIHDKAQASNGQQTYKIAIVPFAQYVNIGTGFENAWWLTGDNHHPSWQGCVGSRAYPHNVKDGDYSLAKVVAVKNVSCPNAITPLTEVDDAGQALLKNRIDALSANGWTYIPAGLAWGWRVLSHKAPFTQGATDQDVKEKSVRRIVILMTDGANTRSPTYPKHGGWNTGLANNLTTEVCDKIKATNPATGKRHADIITITFQVNNTTIKNLLKTCATMGSYDVGSGGLSSVFNNIAQQLVKLHLSM